MIYIRLGVEKCNMIGTKTATNLDSGSGVKLELRLRL